MRYTLLDLPPVAVDRAALEGLTDEAIAAAVGEDPDAAPLDDPLFWAEARPVAAPAKAPISIRVDQDVLAWFRSLGAGYQTRMNLVLRGYMERHRQGG